MSGLPALAARKEIMIAYLRLKMEEEDWHGVQDAASDLRDIESEVKGIDWAYQSVGEEPV